MDNLDIRLLESKVESLIQLSDQLAIENRALKKSQEKWREERSRLVDQNNMARQKISNMIMRLKAMEQT